MSLENFGCIYDGSLIFLKYQKFLVDVRTGLKKVREFWDVAEFHDDLVAVILGKMTVRLYER
jgi:hypothetical protein